MSKITKDRLRFAGTLDSLPKVSDYAKGDVVIYNNKCYIKGDDRWIILSRKGDHFMSPEEQRIWSDMRGLS